MAPNPRVGRVPEVCTEMARRRIKGKSITGNAIADDPACLILQDDGDRVLTSGSEPFAG